MTAYGALQLASLDGVARMPARAYANANQANVAGQADVYPAVHQALAAQATSGEISRLIESLLDAVVMIEERSLLVVAANSAADRLLRAAPGQLLERSALDFAATPEDACFWSDPAEQRDGELLSDSLMVRDDGTVVPVTRRIARVMLGGETHFLVSLRDRSEQQRIETELEVLVAELSATLESTADGLLAVDVSGRIRGFNRHFAALWSLPETLAVRQGDSAVADWMLQQVSDPAAYRARLDALDKAVNERSPEVLAPVVDTIELKDSKVLERVAVLQRSRGAVMGRVYSFRDITERLAAHRRIERLGHTDSLTGLPNRRSLEERMQHALAVAQREGTSFAVLFLDLDRFKHINDTFGHAFGDRVLLDTTERLKSCLRHVDTVARPSGDEFVLIVHEADIAGAEAAARRVMDAMASPFVLDGVNFTVTCSIGVAMFPTDGGDMEQLLRSADMAMYQVKQLGRSGYRFYQPGKEVDHRTRVKLDHAMRRALAAGSFSLHYQPRIDLSSGEMVGAEALMRWHDPVLGEVPPQEFFPLAEESGFIIALCDWALNQAIEQAAAWHAAGRPLRVSVNIAALQFHRAGFIDDLEKALSDSGVPPSLLELELTEAILLKDADEALRRLQQLSALGVRLAIDDFGTGYSSLAYMKRFPVQRLKIDGSFVLGVADDESDAGIALAIIGLARALRLKVVAEGVETEAQRRFLSDAGCDEYQGFLYAPALPVADFEALREIGGNRAG